MAFEIFGYSISKADEKEEQKDQSKLNMIEAPQDKDGAQEIDITNTGGSLHQVNSIQLDQSYAGENDLIYKYREMSNHPEVDWAISEIVSEAIVDVDNGETIELNLDEVEITDKVKDKLHEEFEHILHLLSFEFQGEDLFKDWYVDGRIAFHKVINSTQPKQGIQKLIQLDPIRLKKIREVEREQTPSQVEKIKRTHEYYIYTEGKSSQNDDHSRSSSGRNAIGQSRWKQQQALKMKKDTVAYIGSAKFDEANNMVGYLHKAIRPLNHLKSIEDAVVIHRVAHAPERRVFYIGTGTMNSKKALQHVRDVMQMHRNKVVYDAKTGELQSDKKYQAYTEDFWLPRSEDGKNTEIDTLQSNQNFDATEELNWFQNKLYRALNIPPNRLEQDSQLVFASRQSEISRDEVKFQKFIANLRKKFSRLFLDLLRTQLLLKNIVDEKEWQEIEKNIRFDFRKDNPYAEQKELETIAKRVEMMRDVQDLVGDYYSKLWVKKNILRMTDEEIEEEKKQIEQEKEEQGGDEDGAADSFF